MTGQTPEQTQQAKSLRAKQTEAEGLLGAVLRTEKRSGMMSRPDPGESQPSPHPALQSDLPGGEVKDV